MNKQIQVKHIPTTPILEFLNSLDGKWATWGDGHSMPTVQDVMPKDIPIKVQLAKMKNLIKKGLVSGCGCGCRGDFAITKKGIQRLDSGGEEIKKFIE